LLSSHRQIPLIGATFFRLTKAIYYLYLIYYLRVFISLKKTGIEAANGF